MLLPQSNQKHFFRRAGSAVFFGLILAIAAGTPLTASAATAQLVCSSTFLKFGWVAVGTSETQLVVLTNTGSTPVALSGIGVSNAEFKVLGAGFPKTLSAGGSIAVNIIFSPAATGWVSGQVAFASDAANPILALPVRGTGVAKEPVTASPSTLTFGNVAVGTTATTTVELTNNCLCTQTLSAVQIAGGGFSLTSPSLPITLDRHQSVTLTIAFAPQAAGVSGSSVLVDGPYLNIPVSGTGTTIGVLSVTPGALNFGNVVLGTTATEPAELTASGGSVTVTSAASSNGQFSMPGASFPLTIANGQSASFSVVFTPTAAGTVSGNLSFSTSGSTSKTVEALTATAAKPYVSLSWSPSTSDVAGYNIYRGTSSSGPFSRLNPSPDTNTAFLDNGVAVGQTYFYATTAVNSSGEESTYSNLVQVSVP